jgi:hypothetical protein
MSRKIIIFAKPNETKQNFANGAVSETGEISRRNDSSVSCHICKYPFGSSDFLIRYDS